MDVPGRTSIDSSTGNSGRLGILIASLLVACPAFAQEHPIRVSARLAPSRERVRPGDTVSVLLRAEIPSGWHLYSLTQPPGGPIATTIDVGPRTLVSLTGTIESPMPVLARDPNFGIQSEWYQDSTSIRVPLRLSTNATVGPARIDVRIGYQTCTDRYCLPPTEDTLHVALVVAGRAVSGVAASAASAGPALTPHPASAAARRPDGAPAVPPVDSRSSARSFLLFLWLAGTMGALSLLTPCVFPMVPITVSYFSRRDRVSRAAAVGDAALYAGGIVVAFSGIGIGLSSLLGVAGLNRFAADPWLNLGIATLFVLFALSLFGVLHLTLPSGLLTWLDRASGGTQLGRVATTLLMGVTFALTTFTCTAPFVGTLLVSATQGDWRWPAAGLLMFSTVFALPFLVLALVPQGLARLPKSGEWMSTMQGTLAFIELAAALKFLSNADLVQGWGLFTRTTVLALWLAIGLCLTLYLFGVRIAHARVRRTERWYRAPSFGALAATLFVATGLGDRRLGELEPFLPPAGGNADGVANRNELPWLLDDLVGGLAAGRRQHKLVLIDFTGYTCTNCRWMEANMFPRPDVVRELAQFVRVRLFTDGRGEIYRRQQAFEKDNFRTVALPLYAVVDSMGTPRATFLGMTRDTKEFLQFLNAARTVR